MIDLGSEIAIRQLSYCIRGVYLFRRRTCYLPPCHSRGPTAGEGGVGTGEAYATAASCNPVRCEYQTLDSIQCYEP